MYNYLINFIKNCIMQIMMLSVIFSFLKRWTAVVVFLVCLLPSLGKASSLLDKVIYGTWSIYGFAMYQTQDRILTPGGGKPQEIYKSKMFYGVGIGKDNLRLDYTRYFDSPKLAFSVDLLKNSLITPYVSFLYVAGLGLKDTSGVTRDKVVQFDMAVGFSISAVRFLDIYVEYLLKDSSFFTGIRIKLPYTF